jgi:hypothetical protein
MKEGIPILYDHDPTKIIGRVSVSGHEYIIEFLKDQIKVNTDMFLNIFGNIGGEILECEMRGEERIIHKFRICEFSVNPILGKDEKILSGVKDVIIEPGRVEMTEGIKTIPMDEDLLRLTEKLLDQNRMILQANVELLKLLSRPGYYVDLSASHNWKEGQK